MAKANNTDITTNNCNCHVKDICPIDQTCQTSSLVYKASVTRHDNKNESYTGLTDNTFKTQYKRHTNSFRNEKCRNATTLSNYIWMLKEKKKHKLLTKVVNHRQRKGLSGLREKLWPLWLRKIIHTIKIRINKDQPMKWTCYKAAGIEKHLLCNK